MTARSAGRARRRCRRLHREHGTHIGVAEIRRFSANDNLAPGDGAKRELLQRRPSGAPAASNPAAEATRGHDRRRLAECCWTLRGDRGSARGSGSALLQQTTARDPAFRVGHGGIITGARGSGLGARGSGLGTRGSGLGARGSGLGARGSDSKLGFGEAGSRIPNPESHLPYPSDRGRQRSRRLAASCHAPQPVKGGDRSGVLPTATRARMTSFGSRIPVSRIPDPESRIPKRKH